MHQRAGAIAGGHERAHVAHRDVGVQRIEGGECAPVRHGIRDVPRALGRRCQTFDCARELVANGSTFFVGPTLEFARSDQMKSL